MSNEFVKPYRKRRKKDDRFNPTREYITTSITEFLKSGGKITQIESRESEKDIDINDVSISNYYGADHYLTDHYLTDYYLTT